jgi:nitroimidazol reductase NimA-like FMN-containing flavoprotein (pyridoxamine 5'-phosphate oxidase superfamily)
MMTSALEPLSRHDCLSLLGHHHLGRLAVAVGAQPLIFPVGYALDGDSIIFLTDPGTKLHAARGQRVAFEIDGVDGRDRGWSVLVVGRAEAVEAAAEQRRLRTLDFGPWSRRTKSHVVRIRGGAITGRIVSFGGADQVTSSPMSGG